MDSLFSSQVCFQLQNQLFFPPPLQIVFNTIFLLFSNDGFFSLYRGSRFAFNLFLSFHLSEDIFAHRIVSLILGSPSSPIQITLYLSSLSFIVICKILWRSFCVLVEVLHFYSFFDFERGQNMYSTPRWSDRQDITETLWATGCLSCMTCCHTKKHSQESIL